MGDRIVGVIPAAGYGTRLQPNPGSKEMTPVGGRPMIEHLVRRMRVAGVTEIRIVTRPEKVDVIGYAARSGAGVIRGHPGSLGESVGLGLAGLQPDHLVAFGFPDSVWSPVDGFAAVLELHREHPGDIALGLFEADELERMEPVHADPEGRVTAIEIRPPVPTTKRMWGCLVAQAGALSGVERHAEPGRFLDARARAGYVWGVPLGRYLDLGTRPALRRAEADPILSL